MADFLNEEHTKFRMKKKKKHGKRTKLNFQELQNSTYLQRKREAQNLLDHFYFKNAFDSQESSEQITQPQTNLQYQFHSEVSKFKKRKRIGKHKSFIKLQATSKEKLLKPKMKIISEDFTEDLGSNQENKTERIN